MPGIGFLAPPVLEAKHLTGDLEHPFDRLVEWEVLGDLILIDAVIALAKLGCVVTAIPGLQPISSEVVFPGTRVGAKHLGHGGDIVGCLG